MMSCIFPGGSALRKEHAHVEHHWPPDGFHDHRIGHVKDFVFDDESWAIRYLAVNTRNWWPGGKKVLAATRWADSIDGPTGRSTPG